MDGGEHQMFNQLDSIHRTISTINDNLITAFFALAILQLIQCGVLFLMLVFRNVS